MSTQQMGRVGLTRFDAPAQWTVVGSFFEPTWDRVVKQLEVPELWPGGGTTQYAQARLPGWSFASYVDNARVASEDPDLAARATAERVLKVHGLFVSYQDDPTVDADHIATWWGRWRYAAYTTAFHQVEKLGRPAGPRWVVMLPLKRPVSIAEAELLGQWATHPRRGAGLVHEHTADLWRFWYLPSVAPGGYRHAANEGRLLDPSECQRDINAWNASDQRREARQLLRGTAVADTVVTLRTTPKPTLAAERAPPLGAGGAEAPDAALAVPLRWLPAGTITALAGSPAVDVALEVAVEAAESGAHVLVASSCATRRELLSRMLALRAEETSYQAWSRGQLSADVRDELLDVLAARWDGVRLFTPYTEERTADGLRAAARAVVSLAEDKPVLVVVDGLLGWEPTLAEEGAHRRVTAALQDLQSDERVAIVVVLPAEVPSWAGRVLVASVEEDELRLQDGSDTYRFHWDPTRRRLRRWSG